MLAAIWNFHNEEFDEKQMTSMTMTTTTEGEMNENVIFLI
jgi:hypothetical protein